MRTWTGALIAVLTVGLVMFGLGIRTASNGPAAAANRIAGMPQANGFAVAQPGVTTADAQMPAASAQLAAAPVAGGQAPVLVNCGPGQQTLVRQVWLNGQAASQVECLGGAPAGGVMYPAAQVRTVSDDVDMVRDPRIVRTQSTYRPAARRVEAPRRSWQKTALIIGGSTAAGAGVGGIVGGKKGALIGAAVGGGASSIFEAIKRK